MHTCCVRISTCLRRTSSTSKAVWLRWGQTWFLPLAFVVRKHTFVARDRFPSFSCWRGRWTSEVVKRSRPLAAA